MNVAQKVCTKCGEAKPATTEHFRRDGSKKDGLYPRCKACTKRPRKPAKRTPPHERFWRYVDQRAPNECWPWLSTTDKDGYGSVSAHTPEGKPTRWRAHRMSFELHFGPIPAGHSVCHKCDNPSCVNPAHLFSGTPKHNTHDMLRKRRHQYGERHHGSKLTTEDVKAIRRLRAAGESPYALAERFGVSYYTVHRIASRRGWTHVS